MKRIYTAATLILASACAAHGESRAHMERSVALASMAELCGATVQRGPLHDTDDARAFRTFFESRPGADAMRGSYGPDAKRRICAIPLRTIDSDSRFEITILSRP